MTKRDKDKKKESLRVFLIDLFKENDQSIYHIELGLNVISCLQILSLINHNFFEYTTPDHQSFAKFLYEVSNLFNLMKYMNVLASNKIIIIGFIAAWNIILILSLVLFLYFCKNGINQINKSTKLLWKTGILFHSNVLALWIIEFSLYILSLEINSSNDAGIIISIALLLFCSTTLALFGAKFNFCELRDSETLARRNNDVEFSGLLLKIIDVFIFFVIPSIRTWARHIIMILLSFRQIYLFSKSVYFETTPQILFSMFAYLQLGSSVLALLGDLFGTSAEGLCYQYAIFFPLLIKFNSMVNNSMIHRFATCANSDFLRTHDDFYKTLYSINAIIKKGFMKKDSSQSSIFDSLLFSKLFLNHTKKCKTERCICSQVASGELENKINREELLLMLETSILDTFYQSCLLKFKNNTDMKIAFAYFLLQKKTGSEGAAVSMLYTCRKINISLKNKVMLNKIFYQIENKIVLLSKESDQRIDIGEIMDYFKLRVNLRLLINTNIDRFIKFWQTYLKGNPNFLTLFNINQDLDTGSEEIDCTWKKLTSMNSLLVYSESMIYGLYLYLIRGAAHTSETVLKKLINYQIGPGSKENQNFCDPILEKNLHYEGTINIMAHMTREKMGQINFISSQIEDYGYQRDEFKEKNIHYLIPKYFKQAHQRIIDEHFQSYRSDIFYSNRQVFALHKNGYLIPINIYISPAPYIFDSFQYAALIRRRPTSSKSILINSGGKIVGLCEKIGRFLNIQPDQEIFLKDICLDHLQIMKYIKHKSSNRMLEGSTMTLIETNQNFNESLNEINPEDSIFREGIVLRFNPPSNTYETTFFKVVLSNVSHRYCQVFEVNLTTVTEDELDAALNKEEDSSKADASFSDTDCPQPIPDFINDDAKESDVSESPVIKVKMNRRMVSNHKKYMTVIIEANKVKPTNTNLYYHENNPTKKDEEEEDLNMLENKEFLNLFQAQDHQSIGGSSVANLKRNLNGYLEKAIYYTKSSKSLIILKYSAYFHLVISVILLINYAINALSTMDKLPKVMDISTANFNRHYYLWIWIYWSNCHLYLLKRGYLVGRYDINGDDLFYWLAGGWKDMASSLLEYDRQIQSNMTYLEEYNARRLYDPIRMRPRLDPNSYQITDMFALDKQIASACINLFQYSKDRSSEFSWQDPDFQFIFNNMLDDPYIQEENVYRLVLKDVEDKIQLLKDLSVANTSVIISIEVVLFAIMLIGELQFIRDKKTFIESFTHTKYEEVERELLFVQNFKETVGKTDLMNKFIKGIKKKNQLARIKVKNERMEYKELQKKSQGNVNSNHSQRTYLYLGYGAIFQGVIMSILIIIFNVLGIGQNTMIDLVSKSVNANLLFNKFGTCFLSLYLYISEDGNFTIRNNPIRAEWQSDYDEIAKSINFFDRIIDETPSKYLSEVKDILNGDLCALMYDYTGCVGAREEASKGLLSLNSMMISYTRAIKLDHDNSDLTFYSDQVLFNRSEVIAMEWAYWLYIPPAYQKLEEITRYSVLEKIDEFRRNSTIYISIFVAGFILLIGFIWMPIWRVFREERIKLHKIYRIIPMNIIKSNRFVSNYLINNTDGILNAVKHLL